MPSRRRSRTRYSPPCSSCSRPTAPRIQAATYVSLAEGIVRQEGDEIRVVEVLSVTGDVDFHLTSQTIDAGKGYTM